MHVSYNLLHYISKRLLCWFFRVLGTLLATLSIYVLYNSTWMFLSFFYLCRISVWICLDRILLFLSTYSVFNTGLPVWLAVPGSILTSTILSSFILTPAKDQLARPPSIYNGEVRLRRWVIEESTVSQQF